MLTQIKTQVFGVILYLHKGVGWYFISKTTGTWSYNIVIFRFKGHCFIQIYSGTLFSNIELWWYFIIKCGWMVLLYIF